MLNRFTFTIFTILFLSSCNRDLPLPERLTSQKPVLMGELVAGDSLYVRAGQSIPVTGQFGLLPSPLSGLSVNVLDGSGRIFLMREERDFLFFNLYTQPFVNDNHFVRSGESYQVTAKHDKLGTATAAVTIPQVFYATISPWQWTNLASDTMVSIDLFIEDQNINNNQYVIEVIRQTLEYYRYFYIDGQEYSYLGNEALYDSLNKSGIAIQERVDTVARQDINLQPIYSGDPFIENYSAGANRAYNRAFLPGKDITSTRHTSRIYVKWRDIRPEFLTGTLLDVRIKSVSKLYYQYLKNLDQYNPEITFGINNTIVNLQGNVQGGFGMVGGVYRRRFSLIF